uniref:SFRICE_028257 n=1 Tax=Spodoptera frugiperda TaxID=7108 RepID=A0A2H1WQ06_SPOFR
MDHAHGHPKHQMHYKYVAGFLGVVEKSGIGKRVIGPTLLILECFTLDPTDGATIAVSNINDRRIALATDDCHANVGCVQLDE